MVRAERVRRHAHSVCYLVLLALPAHQQVLLRCQGCQIQESLICLQGVIIDESGKVDPFTLFQRFGALDSSAAAAVSVSVNAPLHTM